MDKAKVALSATQLALQPCHTVKRGPALSSFSFFSVFVLCVFFPGKKCQQRSARPCVAWVANRAAAHAGSLVRCSRRLHTQGVAITSIRPLMLCLTVGMSMGR